MSCASSRSCWQLPWSAARLRKATAPANEGRAGTRRKEKIKLDVLKGAWVRPDGGYTIVIKSIGPNGQLEAMYFNPNPLPLRRPGIAGRRNAARILRIARGGYNGSTYELSYDPASDRLKGTYYQAVAKQKFDIYFVRK